MVLSRNGSVIWGYSPNKQDKIDIYLSDKLIGTVIADYAVPYSWKDDVYEWQFAIPALKPDESVFGPHTIIVEGRGNEDEGKVKAKKKILLPRSKGTRNIILIQPKDVCPKTYPRKVGKPEKYPL